MKVNGVKLFKNIETKGDNHVACAHTVVFVLKKENNVEHFQNYEKKEMNMYILSFHVYNIIFSFNIP